MAGIIDRYLQEFVPFYERSEEAYVNIESLIELTKDLSPVVLDYNDKYGSVKNLGAAIIVNFCKTYKEKQAHSKKGLEMLTRIIRKSVDLPDVVAQQIFLVHITKKELDVEWSAFFFKETNQLKIKIILSSNELQWKELANKIIQHKQINEIIDGSITVFGHQRLTDVNEKEEKIDITIVENVTTILRGFAGFQEIYINSDHFAKKISSFTGDIQLLQLVAKMDIISVVIHEFSHIKIRKCTGNQNMHTPLLAALKGLNQYEFGIYNEICVFNAQVDWFQSAEGSNTLLDINYMERFIDAIEKGTQLPTGSIQGALSRTRTVSSEAGADLLLPTYLC